MANRIISPQQMMYARFQSKSANAVGQFVSVYDIAFPIAGNIQPIPRSRYENMGLDFQKTYVNIYVQKGVIDIDRDVAGDHFTYGCDIYEAMSKTSWHMIDGWDAVLCVKVPS
jgi:hypothetical protein